MARKKRSNGKKAMVKRGGVRKGAGAGLDPAAAAYAKLLMDPCGAPVVHPVYPGGDSGYLFRAESFATFCTGATDTAGFVHWTPGYVNSSYTHLVAGNGANAGATLTALENGNSPGTTFLAANARAARCVAACMKVTFPGTEAQRSGRVHYGLTSAGMIDASKSYTVDSVCQALQHFSRTPTDTFELIWKPSVADTEFNDPNENASAVIRDRKSALTVAFAGLPAGVGLTFHFTAVYEWTPANGIGIGHNALGKAQSNSTFDQVLDRIIQSGFTFVRHAGAQAGNVLGNALTAGIAGTFGIMPTLGRTRTLAFR